MWILFASGSAICAALVAIFGKIGLKGIDPTLATIVRSVVMAIILILSGFVFGKYKDFDISIFNNKAGVYVLLSALAGALSWVLYFIAIKTGPVSSVAIIDKFSVVLVIILAAILLGESLTFKSVLGIVFTIIGSLLILFK